MRGVGNTIAVMSETHVKSNTPAASANSIHLRSHRHSGHRLTQRETHQRDSAQRFKRRHSPTRPYRPSARDFRASGNTTAGRGTGPARAARSATVRRDGDARGLTGAMLARTRFSSDAGMSVSIMVRPLFQCRSQRSRSAAATQSHRGRGYAEAMSNDLERETFDVSHPPRCARIGREVIERVLKWAQFEVGSWCELFLEVERVDRHFVPMAPLRFATMSKQRVLRNAERPSNDGVARQVGVARAMQFEKGLLQQIARTSIIAHAGANERAQARSDRAIQSFERGEASTLVFAHEHIEGLSILEPGHVAARKDISSSMIHLARIGELPDVRRKTRLFCSEHLAGTRILADEHG